jgi:hypothetical protein
LICQNVRIKAVKEHFCRIAADRGIEIMDIVIRKICPGIHENTGEIAIAHFAEAVTNRARAVAVCDTVAGEHNDFILVHKEASKKLQDFAPKDREL